MNRVKKSFFALLDINTKQNTIRLTPSTFMNMGAIANVIKRNKLDFETLGISQDYFLDCQERLIKHLQLIAEELKGLAEQSEPCQLTEQFDYNLLDYYDGLCKAAHENNIASWDQLGFNDVSEFNEHLDLIKECIITQKEKQLTPKEGRPDSWRHLTKTLLPDYGNNEADNTDDDEEVLHESKYQHKLIEERSVKINTDDTVHQVLKFFSLPEDLLTIQLADPATFELYDHLMAKEIDKIEQPLKTCCAKKLINQSIDRIAHG